MQALEVIWKIANDIAPKIVALFLINPKRHKITEFDFGYDKNG